VILPEADWSKGLVVRQAGGTAIPYQRIRIGKAPLHFRVRNPNAGQRIANEVNHVFEVTKYDHPHIFVTSHRTGETYKFSIRSDGALTHPEAHSAQGAARGVATAWLAQQVGKRELELAQAEA
jgi:hypothetical protein